MELHKRADPNSFFCPMVKANAYGHGMVEVASRLIAVGVKFLGVALVEEGVELREKLRAIFNDEKFEILVFADFNEVALATIKEFSLTPVVSSWRQIEILEASFSGKKRMKIHIKINTGMNRIGFVRNSMEALKEYFASSAGLQLAGMCTHLAQAEDSGLPDGMSFQQLMKFSIWSEKFIPKFPAIAVHVYNSAGWLGRSLWDNPAWRSFGTRPGIAIYGYAPKMDVFSEGVSSRSIVMPRLKPVMSVLAEIVAIQAIKKGEKVSYGGLWSAPKDSMIGIVAFGYGDGYPRALSNQGSVLFRGHSVRVVGAVCMDYILIDLTGIVESKEDGCGDQVTLFGSGQAGAATAETLANLSHRISYEILTQIGSRVPRVFVD